jgi:hypothetical protein
MRRLEGIPVRRIEGRGIDLVTRVHSVVAAIWMLSTFTVLVLAVWMAVAMPSNSQDVWARIVTFLYVATTSSVAMLVVALFYSIGTSWGFFRDRKVVLNWGLFIAATAFGGPSITMARGHSIVAVIVLTAAEMAVLLAASAIGVSLRRSRRNAVAPQAV